MMFLVAGKKYIWSELSLSRVVGLQASIAAVVKRATDINKILWWLKVCVQKSNTVSTTVIEELIYLSVHQSAEVF